MRVSSGTARAADVPKIAPTLPSGQASRPAGGVRHRNFIEPLARGLSVLQAFTPVNGWLGNQEVAARVNLPTATVNRLLKSLYRLGYLSFSPQRRQYRLAPTVLNLGYAAVANSNVRQHLRSHMQRLADELNVFVTLGQRDRLDIVLLDICHSNSSLLSLRLEPGARVPISQTAMGWALMAALPEEEQEYLFSHIERKDRAHWPAVERDIARAFAQIRRSGYCSSLGAWRSEITTVSVPFVPVDRSSPLVLGCSGVSPYLPASRIAQQVGPALVALAKQLSQDVPGSQR